jgi:uncharacterized membrane protein
VQSWTSYCRIKGTQEMTIPIRPDNSLHEMDDSAAHSEPSQRDVDRRGRRRHGISRAFKAIKAEHAAHRTRMDMLSETLTRIASSTPFLVFHALGFSLWIIWNMGFFPDAPIFDPYPFGMLTMVVSLEAIFLSIFVLMTQNKESAIAELREELTLQVNLRMEEEVTKTLHLVAGLYTRLGHTLSKDPELEQMLEPLDPQEMERELTEQIRDAIPNVKLRRMAERKQAKLDKAEAGKAAR